jgi:hypothetical protein
MFAHAETNEGQSAEITLNPTKSGTGFITSLSQQQLGGAPVSNLTSSPFSTSEASFLASPELEGANSVGSTTTGTPVGVAKQVQLQVDLPLPLDILHPEVQEPNAQNCFSHSDAISTGECNSWCAVNPEECLTGFVGVVDSMCRTRNPKLSSCDCLRLMQQAVYTGGQIPLTIISNPILNAQMTQQLLNGPMINNRCGPLLPSQRKLLAAYGPRAPAKTTDDTGLFAGENPFAPPQQSGKGEALGSSFLRSLSARDVSAPPAQVQHFLAPTPPAPPASVSAPAPAAPAPAPAPAPAAPAPAAPAEHFFATSICQGRDQSRLVTLGVMLFALYLISRM